MIIIKDMETDDEIKGKAYVHWKAWQEAYRGIVDQAYLDSLTLEKCVKTAYRWPDNIIVAKDLEKVVGFAGYGKYRDDELENAGEVFSIYVLSEYYGKGVGYRLMNEAFSRLQEYSRIALWVLENNERAIRFYERFGFRMDGREEVLNLGSPVKEVRMVLDK